jgi:hypothetical protein
VRGHDFHGHIMNVFRLLPSWKVSPLLFSAIACSSSGEPPSSVSVGEPPSSVSVTVLVANATCNPGPCTPLRILAFPNNQPHTPGGFWSLDLGLVITPSACLTIPPAATFRVTDAGSGATTTYAWASTDSLSLGTLRPSASAIQATPSTAALVPMSAPGWSVALPSTSGPAPSGACTP